MNVRMMLAGLLCCWCLAILQAAQPVAAPSLKTEHFDRDPGWEAFNNRIQPEKVPVVTQDFGYSTTSFATDGKGEVGGMVTRANKPAYYAAAIKPRTLGEPLSASGTFALTHSTPAGGLFFGWFNDDQPGGGGRPMNSLGINLDTEHSGGRLAVRLITGTNKSCGTFITPFIPGKYRPTPIKNDGTRYTFRVTYDPAAASGQGQFQFVLQSNSAKPEEFEGKTFTVDLPPGYQAEGATFNRFGIMNMMKSGGSLKIYFANLEHDGVREDFARDPNWAGSGNRAKYEESDPIGAHDFGFSDTNFAGGKSGEVGGKFWRSGLYGYYADRVGPLSMDDRLEARGRVVLKVGAPDSDMFLGWFNSTERKTPPNESGNFLGVHVGGPTRVGHYFHPAMTTSQGNRAMADGGPTLTPGKTFEWTLIYDPAGNGGNGEIRVTLGDQLVTLALKQGLKKQGGTFDRFGLFTSTIGGQLVRVYLDDLSYTAQAKKE